MKKKLSIIFCILLLINASTVLANRDTMNKAFINKYFFNVDLKGVKEIYFFRELPLYNDKGQVSPLAKSVLSVLQDEVWTWVREPRIYVMENVAYIHAVELEGLNILFTLKKENGNWKVFKRETKKLPSVGSNVILEKAFLRAIGPKILDATKTYYGEPRLFYHDGRIIDIARNIRDDYYDITVQIITFEGPHNPPYGLDTITLRIPQFEVIKYDHKDISDVTKIQLESH